MMMPIRIAFMAWWQRAAVFAGTNQGNLSESHKMLFRRSQPFRRSDLGHAEGSNPSATAKAGPVAHNPEGSAHGWYQPIHFFGNNWGI